MANSLVIRKGTNVAKRDRTLRAAQYLRMSTHDQRYSIQNQAATIAIYAQQNNLAIVRTYRDDGRSGLRIRNRAGLTELIDDASSGRADYDHILVYDVTRWGRFQDVDESAYYEFICKKNGIKVVYCAEQFSNDGSLLSNIAKNIKRAMAGEWSRELGVKVHAGQARIAGLGYRVGGPVGFGLRRELLDEAHQSRGQLSKGQHKALKTDRVKLVLGSEEERAVVGWIFHAFVTDRLSFTEIARRLNRNLVPCGDKVRWTDGKVRTILGNENYVGNLVYNRTSRRLGQKLIANPSDQWVRHNGVIDPVVDANLFARTQKMLAERRMELPEDEMLRRLRLLLHRKGRLSSRLINETPGVPSVSAFVLHFGTLRAAFERIGYVTKRDCDWIDTRNSWAEVIRKHAAYVAEVLASIRAHPSDISAVDHTIKVQGTARVTFMVARQTKKLKPGHTTHWRVYRRQEIEADMLAVLRLGAANREIADCVLIPAVAMTKRYLRLSSVTKLPPQAARVESFAEMVQALKTRFGIGKVAA
ncbi:recombinase family protein [Bradyrhizobium sp. UNPF46]|uniref:recombinase family protein n=1 Tax=Bradyrhizobium sp. UNPF46 TaxID=1141168 RepID=UPI0011539D37|nr:recombinase family protein [Bradyrhizobium sp. UNPF46]